MKFAWDRLFPSLLVVGAVACGQSNPSTPSPIAAGGSSGSPGGAGASPAGGSASGGAGASGGGAANAGSAGLGTTSGGTGGTSGGAGGSGASGGAAGGPVGPTMGSGCTAPGTICWDFEEGAMATPTGWTAYRNEFNGSLAVDNTKAHHGTFALHAKGLWGGAAGADGGPKKSIRYNLPANFGPVLWGRMWVYTTIVSDSHTGLFNARYPRPGTTDTDISKLDWYEAATYTGKYMTVWHPPEPPGFPEWVKVADTAGVTNAWSCLEWEFDGANGTQPQAADPRMWLNGTELNWPAPFVFSVPATTVRPTQEKVTNFTVLETGVYMYQWLAEPGSDTWIDELAVGKERIGCQ